VMYDENFEEINISKMYVKWGKLKFIDLNQTKRCAILRLIKLARSWHQKINP
jgi:hypothetical protein